VARIAGVDLPREKRVEIGLTYIFGLGRTRAIETVKGTRVNPNTRVRDLSEEEVVRHREWIYSHYKVEGDLRREVQQDIKRKIEIGCYQGIRHRRGLPVRGQRTHTNARTRKGPRRGVMIKKKPTAAPAAARKAGA
jgi:small subunit ribosomal protein S13